MSRPLNATAASLLGLLSQRPSSGWELYARFEQSIGNFWSVTRSQIYRELQTLEARGFVELGPTGARERRVATITPDGRTAFTAWIAAFDDDETIRFPLLLSTFFGDAVRPEELLRRTTSRRARHAERLVQYLAMREHLVPHPFPALALDFGVRYERMVLGWIDELPWMREAVADTAERRG